MVVAHPRVQRKDLGRDAPEQHVGVDDLLALLLGVLGVHDARARTGGGEDARALIVARRLASLPRGAVAVPVG